MQELRYNPLTDEWIIVSAETQKRPVQPSQQSCPICIGGAELPQQYDLVSFDNKFPALLREPPEVVQDDFFQKERSYGVCEVVVYTSDHNTALPGMPLKQIEKLVEMWVDRTIDLSKYDFVKYIFIFENRGKEVGASLPHPHGQLYAFPFIPKRIETKLMAMKKWYKEKGSCVICDVVKQELMKKERIVCQTKHFLAVVPFYARFPFEVHIYPKRHVSYITQLSGEERSDFAKILKLVTSKYDALYQEEFPYMMMFFQAPVNVPINEEIFHFHVEFNPPKRDKDKIKWMASVETGTWTFINPVVPEQAAKMLREAKVEGEECQSSERLEE
ncbi:galactose-1-phosphate uridylyltransferase [Pseudothermotoga thermarum]|nr:galactose-1-phosphate uridylyltransferase [Pseudothermotoga thermarum]